MKILLPESMGNKPVLFFVKKTMEAATRLRLVRWKYLDMAGEDE